MARLQVLHLPAVDGEPQRFAFIVDQAAELDAGDRTALSAFAASAGGQGCVVLSGSLDVDQGTDAETAAALGELLQDAMSVPAIAQAAAPQAPKLPPINTTEGRLARTWGGRPSINDGDPL